MSKNWAQVELSDGSIVQPAQPTLSQSVYICKLTLTTETTYCLLNNKGLVNTGQAERTPKTMPELTLKPMTMPKYQSYSLHLGWCLNHKYCMLEHITLHHRMKYIWEALYHILTHKGRIRTYSGPGIYIINPNCHKEWAKEYQGINK